MSCGIYMIKNKVNKKVYIGLSNKIELRWASHKLASQHADSLLYSDMRDFGIDNFEFIILEECFPDELSEKEFFWCDAMKSYYPSGYNLHLAGSGVRTKLSSADVSIIRDIIINKQDVDFKDLALKFNFNSDTIYEINKGKIGRVENMQYPLRKRKIGNKHTMSRGTSMQIIDFLNSTNYSFKEISDFMGVGKNMVLKINKGMSWVLKNIKYPIRKIRLSDSEVDEIRDLLRNSKIPMSYIAKEYNVVNATITFINTGKTRFCEKEVYPIR